MEDTVEAEDLVVRIARVTNGYIIETSDGRVVVEENGTEFGELEAMRTLLWAVTDCFGINNSKHNQKNLVIEIRENKI